MAGTTDTANEVGVSDKVEASDEVEVSARDRTRIAAHAICSSRTVDRVYAGGGSDYSRARVERAAVELGLPSPPVAERRSA